MFYYIFNSILLYSQFDFTSTCARTIGSRATGDYTVMDDH